jgi:hypothetical protein
MAAAGREPQTRVVVYLDVKVTRTGPRPRPLCARRWPKRLPGTIIMAAAGLTAEVAASSAHGRMGGGPITCPRPGWIAFSPPERQTGWRRGHTTTLRRTALHGRFPASQRRPGLPGRVHPLPDALLKPRKRKHHADETHNLAACRAVDSWRTCWQPEPVKPPSRCSPPMDAPGLMPIVGLQLRTSARFAARIAAGSPSLPTGRGRGPGWIGSPDAVMPGLRCQPLRQWGSSVPDLQTGFRGCWTRPPGCRKGSAWTRTNYPWMEGSPWRRCLRRNQRSPPETIEAYKPGCTAITGPSQRWDRPAPGRRPVEPANLTTVYSSTPVRSVYIMNRGAKHRRPNPAVTRRVKKTHFH